MLVIFLVSYPKYVKVALFGLVGFLWFVCVGCFCGRGGLLQLLACKMCLMVANSLSLFCGVMG